MKRWEQKAHLAVKKARAQYGDLWEMPWGRNPYYISGCTASPVPCAACGLPSNGVLSYEKTNWLTSLCSPCWEFRTWAKNIGWRFPHWGYNKFLYCREYGAVVVSEVKLDIDWDIGARLSWFRRQIRREVLFAWTVAKKRRSPVASIVLMDILKLILKFTTKTYVTDETLKAIVKKNPCMN